MTEEGSSKRQRISQACESCRKRKSKCDGSHPICNICRSSNRVCIYESSGRKRGLQVGYVRSIETVLGLMTRDLPGVEHALRSLLRTPDIAGAFFDVAFVDTVTEAWHSSQLHEDIKELLKSHDGGEIGANSSKLPPLVGQLSPRQISTWKTSQHLLDEETAKPSTQSTQSETIPINHLDTLNVESPELSTEPPLSEQPPKDETQALIDYETFKLPDNAAELVDDYFTHIHPWFPIMERRDILHILHFFEAHDSLNMRDKSRRACLLAIIAVVLASRYSNPGDDQAHDPTTVPINRWDVDGTGLAASKIANMVKSMTTMAITDQELDIGHIQALLLVVLIDLSYRRFNAAWVSLAAVSRMLSVYAQSQELQTSRLAHVVRGCQILDILVSIMLDKPINTFLGTDITITMNEDDLDEWEVWTIPKDVTLKTRRKRVPLRALSIFNMTHSLFHQLATAYSMSRASMTFQELLQSLQDWHTMLPSYCRLQNSELSTPCALVLNLYFNFALTTILRITDHDPSKHIIAKNVARTILSVFHQYNQINKPVSPYIHLIVEHCLSRLEALDPAAVPRQSSPNDAVLKTRTHASQGYWKSPMSYGAQTSHGESTHIVPTYVGMGDPQQPSISDAVGSSEQIGSNFDFGSLFANIIPGSLENDNNISVISGGHTLGFSDFGSLHERTLNTMPENDFDVLFEELPLGTGGGGPVSDTEFAQNLGFLTSSMDSEFVALFEVDDQLP